jgi:peptidyl-prolyl cis-trans isomerase A (cyclophilin A)
MQRPAFRPADMGRAEARPLHTMKNAILASVALTAIQAVAPDVRVAIETELGTIVVAVDTAHAPATSANFLRYVREGFYDGGRFHRAVRPDTETRTDFPIQVIQAGINQAKAASAFPAIALERTSATGLKHVDGVVSMARNGPDTGRSDFFVCIGDMPELDFGGKRNADGQGFAAFGRVVSGMDVVRRIQAAAVREGTQNLEPPIRIIRASVLKGP